MSDPEIFSRLSGILGEGKAAVLCTLVEKRGSGPRGEGAKMLVDEEGNAFGTIGGGGMERALVKEALEALEDGHPRTLAFALGVEPAEGAVAVDSKCGGEVRIFLDVIKPDPRLVVVGSGHIGKPLAELAHMVGFEVVVVDDAVTTTPDRFPQAERLYPGPFEEELARINVRPSDFVAVVHGETGHEISALKHFLPQGPTYIGLLGSSNKAAEHRKQLIASGQPAEEVDRIRAPIGVDIGAETPEEIAVSIVAELIAARRLGLSRRGS